jgi:acyl-CoA synthetase (AMP-forming)/AMP-acid ligase II
VALDPNAVKLLLYTSGTTGDPKGVLHSHNTLQSEVETVTKFWELRSTDVVLMPSPVTHITGYIYAIELTFALGIKLVFMDKWNAANAVELVAAHGATFSVGATPFLVELVAELENQKVILPSLRLFACGGAPVPPEVIRRAKTVLPNCLSFRVYGSSEAPTISLGVVPGDPRELGATTDGCIVNHEVRIVDPENGKPIPAGEEGEILTRGPELMLGYTRWQDTVDTFDDQGFFKTGDIGFISNERYLTISGRKKDLIIRGGENISAKEIEDVLHSHPLIIEAAVVAMPHPRMGETPAAYVVLRPGASMSFEELSSYFEEVRLARQKIPECLFVVDEMPRTASGQVLKHVLRARCKEHVANGHERAGMVDARAKEHSGR